MQAIDLQLCASILVFKSWKSVVDHVTARVLKCFSLQGYNYLHGAVIIY